MLGIFQPHVRIAPVPAGRYEAPNFPATNGGRFKEQYDLARNELSSAAERTNMDSSENNFVCLESEWIGHKTAFSLR
jgi:hypothetical protein